MDQDTHHRWHHNSFLSLGLLRELISLRFHSLKVFLGVRLLASCPTPQPGGQGHLFSGFPSPRSVAFTIATEPDLPFPNMRILIRFHCCWVSHLICRWNHWISTSSELLLSQDLHIWPLWQGKPYQKLHFRRIAQGIIRPCKHPHKVWIKILID